MRILAALALVLVHCACAAGQCVEVTGTELPRTEPSSRNAKIKVLVDGKPLGKAKLRVSLPAGQGVQSFLSDSDGNAKLKALPEGMNCITATGENNLSDVLCLVVPVHAKDELSSFQMVLAAPLPRLNSFDEKVKRMEQRAPALRLRALTGVVLDPLQAVIPKAEIQIYKRGYYPGEPVKTLQTNEVGRFSASLDPGVYTVMVRRSGFRTELQGIEISPEAKDGELRPMLQLQATDTCE